MSAVGCLLLLGGLGRFLGLAPTAHKEDLLLLIRLLDQHYTRRLMCSGIRLSNVSSAGFIVRVSSRSSRIGSSNSVLVMTELQEVLVSTITGRDLLLENRDLCQLPFLPSNRKPFLFQLCLLSLLDFLLLYLLFVSQVLCMLPQCREVFIVDRLLRKRRVQLSLESSLLIKEIILLLPALILGL